MLKVVYRMNNQPGMTTIITVVSNGTTFTKTLQTVNRSEGQNVYYSFIKQNCLQSHQVCGGSFSVKYRNEQLEALKDLRAAGVEIYASQEEWITLAKNSGNLPKVLGAGKEFRPSELGEKPSPILGGNLSPADYINGSRSRD